MSEPSKPQQQQTDVDALARDKVDEIEKLLGASEEHKLDILGNWLSVLKQIITAADLHRTNDKNGKQERENESKVETGDSIYADYADDGEQFNAVDLSEQFATNSVKWTIRVRAFKLVHQIVQLYLIIANNSKSINSTNRSPIMKQLPDLVRLSFVAATSPYDDLKVQGFEMFKFIIDKFAAVEDRELPGHSILEQYKTQVLSALKPTFNPDAPPYITAIASQVCSLWVCCYTENDSISLKRTYQLMLSSIEKLEKQSVNQNSKLYTESELEQERLYILGSWAHMYIVASGISIDSTTSNSSSKSELAELVKPQIDSIIDKWWEALKDYALLTMPAPKNIGVSHDSEHVYTRDVALRLFEGVWSKLVLATAIWLCSYDSSPQDNSTRTDITSNNQQNNMQQNCDNNYKSQIRSSKRKYFKFVSGLLMRELCKCRQGMKQSKSSFTESTSNVVRSLHLLLNDETIRGYFTDSLEVTGEFYSTLSIIYNDRLKSRDPIAKSIKTILELLFEAIVVRISRDSEQVNYGLEQLCKQISDELKVVEESKTQSEDSLIKLSTCFSNLTRLLKLNCDHAISDANILDAIVATFKRIILFNFDPSVCLGFLNHLSGLYQSMRPERVSILNCKLFDTHLAAINQLVLKTNQDANKDNLARQVAYLDSHLKFVRKALSRCETSDLMTPLASLMENLIKLITTESKELSNLFIRHLDEIKKEHPKDYESALSDRMRQDLAKFRESQKEREAVAQPKKPASSQLGPSKLPTKITLKADFSNFYGKK